MVPGCPFKITKSTVWVAHYLSLQKKKPDLPFFDFFADASAFDFFLFKNHLPLNLKKNIKIMATIKFKTDMKKNLLNIIVQKFPSHYKLVTKPYQNNPILVESHCSFEAAVLSG